jgi:hypothetical protein
MAFLILPSPDVVMVLAVVVFVWALIVPMLISRKPDARMEFLLYLMKDFPGNENNGSTGGASGHHAPHEDPGSVGPKSFLFFALHDSSKDVPAGSPHCQGGVVSFRGGATGTHQVGLDLGGGYACSGGSLPHGLVVSRRAPIQNDVPYRDGEGGPDDRLPLDVKCPNRPLANVRGSRAVALLLTLGVIRLLPICCFPGREE